MLSPPQRGACLPPPQTLAPPAAAPAQCRHVTDSHRPQELAQSHFAGIFTHKHELSKCSGADSKLCRKGSLPPGPAFKGIKAGGQNFLGLKDCSIT